MSQFKKMWGILILALASALAPIASAGAATLTATIKLRTLPSTITLCRDAVAHAEAAYSFDVQWQMGFDIDNNATTGTGGRDVILVAQPTPVSNPCGPTNVPTEGNIVAALFKWNGSTYEMTAATVDVALDFGNATLTLTTPVTGDLAGLSASTEITLASAAPYSSAGMINIATDVTDTFNLGNSVTSLPSDVQNCSGPCHPGANWYPLVDLTGASATTDQTTNPSGNSIDVEFDVVALHSTIGICRYPSAFTQPGLADSEWVAQFNISGTDDGLGVGGYDVALFVLTPQQFNACSPSTLPTTAALAGVLTQFDPAQGVYVGMEDVPLDISVSTGKITAHIADTSGLLAGLSSKSLVSIGTQALYGPSAGVYDGFPSTFHYGAAALTDPSNDAQGCVSPCSTAQPWYQEVDLLRASVTQGDRVFSSSFE